MSTARGESPDLRRWADRALASGPMLRIWRAGGRDRTAVLAYHSIEAREGFEEQLGYLGRERQPVGLDEVIRAMAAGNGLPPRPVLITFDDGDRSIADVAAPLLRARSIPAVAFVVAGVIDTQTPYWWEEVAVLVRAGGLVPEGLEGDPTKVVQWMKRCPDGQRMAALEQLRRTAPDPGVSTASQLRSEDLVALERMGVEVANHTMTHPCLPRCSDEKVRSEIVDAHDRLTAILGRAPRAFAYPNGDWDPRAEPVLRELGYEAGFLFDHRLVSPGSIHPLRISRVRVSADASLDRFRILVSGLHPAIHRLRGRR